MKRICRFLFCVLAIAVLLASLAGCTNAPANNNSNVPVNNDSGNVEPDSSEDDPEPFSYDRAEWFCSFKYSPQFTSPAKIINIKTGDVLVACTDPLCKHSSNSETCFFNTSRDDTVLYDVEYSDGHIYFVADKQTSDGRIMKLYDYDISNNRIDEIYTYDYIDFQVKLNTNDKLLFFTALTEEGKDITDSKMGLFSYDPESKAVTLMYEDTHVGDFTFFDDHYIRYARYDEKKDRIIYCRYSYDGSSGETFDTLPDGTPFEIFGWNLKQNGLFSNTEPNGGVYVAEDDTRLMYPTDRATYVPIRYKDSFCFQPRNTEVVRLGKDPNTGDAVMSIAIDNEWYVLSKDGSYKHYSVDCDYHFQIVAIYENIVLGRIYYKLSENGDCILSGYPSVPDIVRIDLDTGKATFYNTSMRNGFIFKQTTLEVTVHEN